MNYDFRRFHVVLNFYEFCFILRNNNTKLLLIKVYDNLINVFLLKFGEIYLLFAFYLN